jgi:hypothetical protein
MKNFIFLLVSLVSLSFNNKLINQSNGITVIKFMGTVTTHPYSTDEKMFWSSKDEHVTLKIRNNDFTEEIKLLENKGSDMILDVKYCFLVKKGKTLDTIYSDESLKSWVFKRKGKYTLFYDGDGKIAKGLRNRYSFFYDCW